MKKARVSKGDRKDWLGKRRMAGVRGRADPDYHFYMDRMPIASETPNIIWRLTQLAASLLFGVLLTSLVLKFSTSYAPEVKTTPVQQWSVSNDYNDLEVDHHRPGGDAYRDELPLGASEVVDHRSNRKRGAERPFSETANELQATLGDQQAVHHATESTVQPPHAVDKAKDVSAKTLDSDIDVGKLIPQKHKKELQTSQSRKQEFQKVASVTQASSKTKIPRARKEGFFLPDAELSPGNEVGTTKGQLGAKQDTGSNRGEDVKKVSLWQGAKGAGASLLDMFLGDFPSAEEKKDLERLALENKGKQTDSIAAHGKGHTYVQANDGVDASQVARIDDQSPEGAEEELPEHVPDKDSNEAKQSAEGDSMNSRLDGAQQQITSKISIDNFLRMQEELMPELRREIAKASAAVGAGSQAKPDSILGSADQA